MSEIVLIGFYLIVLLYSIIIHEVSHGLAALWLGDPTAKYAGRLSLNPKSHIDLWGSVLIPLMMLVASSFQYAFGWAKPVPYNPYNLSNQKWGPALVGLAGPASNICIALIFALSARFINLPYLTKIDIVNNFNQWGDIATSISGNLSAIFFEIFVMIVFWNTLMAFFNLIPIPPLDGSKLLFSVLPIKTETKIAMEQFGFVFLIIFIFLFQGPMGQFLSYFLRLFLNLTI